MSETNTCPRKLVQVPVPVEVIEAIDRLADAETISRSAWIRRLLIGTTKQVAA